jgi:predicted nicotinamide N-methyase
MYDDDGRWWPEEDTHETEEIIVPGLPRPILIKEDLRFGTGGVVWNTALALVDHLVEHPALISDKQHIIELGSGTGFIGIACSILLSTGVGSTCPAGGLPDGPRITVTDYESVIPLLREHIGLNDVAGGVEAATLFWGHTDVSEFGTPVDAVLMADVAFTDAYAELATTLANLCGPETLVLHGYKSRRGNVGQLFFEEIKRHGFTTEALDLPSSVIGWPDGWADGVTLYQHRLRKVLA